MKKLFIIAITTTIFSCNNTNNNNCDSAICTANFKMITVTVTDKNDEKIILDESYTVRLKNNDTIRNLGTLNAGTYVVLSDSYTEQLRNIKEDFQFIGIKDNATIVNEQYNIGADCCHIYLESGRRSVQLP